MHDGEVVERLELDGEVDAVPHEERV
jgi:hypothetical protein